MIVENKQVYPDQINQYLMEKYIIELIAAEEKAIYENKKAMYKGSHIEQALTTNQICYHQNRLSMLREIKKDVEL